MKARIVLLPGDGIGAEVTAAGARVLEAIARAGSHRFEISEAAIGGAAIDQCGEPLPAATLEQCRNADAVLLGAVGGPQWADPDARVRPEQGLLALRRALGVYANLRPILALPSLVDASPLRPERVAGVDMVFVRELTGGVYFGEKHRSATEAHDVCRYSVAEIERTVRFAARLARSRRGRLTSIDKANVLATSQLWRHTASRIVAAEFADVQLEHLLVDAAAMHLLSRPAEFDVLVTENMFGDILSDEASMLAGSLGMLPSAALGDGRTGLYEPVHGSAPDLAGRDMANPYGAILSVAMLLRHSLQMSAEAGRVEAAVGAAIESGARTADIAAGGAAVGTLAATDAVLQAMR